MSMQRANTQYIVTVVNRNSVRAMITLRLKKTFYVCVLWHIDPLLGKDLETNETTAVAMQRSRKPASTTIQLLYKN
jgi:hypothetical protein